MTSADRILAKLEKMDAALSDLTASVGCVREDQAAMRDRLEQIERQHPALFRADTLNRAEVEQARHDTGIARQFQGAKIQEP